MTAYTKTLRTVSLFLKSTLSDRGIAIRNMTITHKFLDENTIIYADMEEFFEDWSEHLSPLLLSGWGDWQHIYILTVDNQGIMRACRIDDNSSGSEYINGVGPLTLQGLVDKAIKRRDAN